MDVKKNYALIDKYLREKGLSWVCDQVKEEIETGKLVEERISTLQERGHLKSKSFYYQPEFKKSQPADFTRRHDYSDAEKLTLLLEAIKRAVFDVTVMEAEISHFFFNKVQSIKFEDERDEQPGRVLAPDTRTLLQEAKEAAAVIDRLTHEISDK